MPDMPELPDIPPDVVVGQSEAIRNVRDAVGNIGELQESVRATQLAIRETLRQANLNRTYLDELHSVLDALPISNTDVPIRDSDGS